MPPWGQLQDPALGKALPTALRKGKPAVAGAGTAYHRKGFGSVGEESGGYGKKARTASLKPAEKDDMCCLYRFGKVQTDSVVAMLSQGGDGFLLGQWKHGIVDDTQSGERTGIQTGAAVTVQAKSCLRIEKIAFVHRFFPVLCKIAGD